MQHLLDIRLTAIDIASLRYVASPLDIACGLLGKANSISKNRRFYIELPSGNISKLPQAAISTSNSLYQKKSIFLLCIRQFFVII